MAITDECKKLILDDLDTAFEDHRADGGDVVFTLKDNVIQVEMHSAEGNLLYLCDLGLEFK